MAPKPPVIRPEPSHCILSFRRPQESQLPLHFSASWASARTAWRFALEPVWRATVALRDFVRSVAVLQASEAGPKAIVVITSF